MGGWVLPTVTVWLQETLLVNASVTLQVRVMNCGQTPFVTVLRMVTVRFEPLQASLAVGASKVQAVPQTVLLLGQVSKGGGKLRVALELVVLPNGLVTFTA
jgi:hypothetical protein